MDAFLRDLPASPLDHNIMGNSHPGQGAGADLAGHGGLADVRGGGSPSGSPPAGNPAVAGRPFFTVDDGAFSPGGSERGVSLDDFVLLKVIGKGSFGKVMMVRKKDTGEVFALKVLRKAELMRRNQVEHTRAERNIMRRARHPFVVRLRYAFQTPTKVFMALELCQGGEVFYHLSKEGRFSEDRSRFYAAQIVLALEYIHSLGVVYRDLKPENVLLDRDGYVKLTDFGLSKENVRDNSSAHSFVGTPEYLSPEVLTRVGHGRASDWWSLGALLYEMLTGMPPFYSRSRDRLFVKILQSKLRMPRHISAEAASLLTGLLNRDVGQRLGSGESDAAEIKAHPFFRGLDWDALLERRLPAPFRPEVRDFGDTSNFDAEFTELPLESAPTAASYLGTSVSDGRFCGFSYCDPHSLRAAPGASPGTRPAAPPASDGPGDAIDIEDDDEEEGPAGMLSPLDHDMSALSSAAGRQAPGGAPSAANGGWGH